MGPVGRCIRPNIGVTMRRSHWPPDRTGERGARDEVEGVHIATRRGGKRRSRRVQGRRPELTTDLEGFVGQEGRDAAVREVRRQIDAEGVTYIYYQFVSVTGRIMGKGIPAEHWETIAQKGFQLVYGSTANLFVDRHGDYIGYGPEARELVGIPEPETFSVLPWDRKVARVFCTLFRGREEEVDGGAFLTSDCRGNLKRIHDAFTAATGLHLRVGCEPEMMWLKLNPDGTPSVEGKTKPYCYHIDQFSELQPIIHKVIEYGDGDGPGHDPGRPRGRAGPARAELHVRQGRADRRPPDHLPADLPAGRPGDGRVRLLHAEAVHGRVGERVPPQHLAVGGRDEQVPPGRRQPADAGPGRPVRHRRRARAPARADLHHGADGELLPAVRRRRASGRRSSPTGASRTGRPRCGSARPAGTSTGASTPP